MRWVVSVCLAWAAATALEAPAAEPCTLRVGWEPYAPFTFADENGEVTGADIDLITAIADAIGCAIVPVELPWARILKEVEQGTLDLSTSTSRTPERDQWALFSRPYRETEIAIYVRRGETPALRPAGARRHSRAAASARRDRRLLLRRGAGGGVRAIPALPPGSTARRTTRPTSASW